MLVRVANEFIQGTTADTDTILSSQYRQTPARQYIKPVQTDTSNTARDTARNTIHNSQ